jgi:hypothetical protein
VPSRRQRRTALAPRRALGGGAWPVGACAGRWPTQIGAGSHEAIGPAGFAACSVVAGPRPGISTRLDPPCEAHSPAARSALPSYARVIEFGGGRRRITPVQPGHWLLFETPSVRSPLARAARSTSLRRDGHWHMPLCRPRPQPTRRIAIGCAAGGAVVHAHCAGLGRPAAAGGAARWCSRAAARNGTSLVDLGAIESGTCSAN